VTSLNKFSILEYANIMSSFSLDKNSISFVFSFKDSSREILSFLNLSFICCDASIDANLSSTRVCIAQCLASNSAVDFLKFSITSSAATSLLLSADINFSFEEALSSRAETSCLCLVIISFVSASILDIC